MLIMWSLQGRVLGVDAQCTSKKSYLSAHKNDNSKWIDFFQDISYASYFLSIGFLKDVLEDQKSPCLQNKWVVLIMSKW